MFVLESKYLYRCVSFFVKKRKFLSLFLGFKNDLLINILKTKRVSRFNFKNKGLTNILKTKRVSRF